MTTRKALKQLASERRAIVVPGAPNALFARAIEDAGFPVIYVSGAGVANMQLGLPDIGLGTVTELVQTVSAIADTVDRPLIVDADTGFGNAMNMYRTVRQLERAGASALQIEDQVFPKKCGHFEGKATIPAAEMIEKIKAALDARQDENLQIIARTDARAVEGLDAAIERAQMYQEAGADMTFVEAPRNVDELGRIARELKAPQVANIVFGGHTPDPGQAALAEMGFAFTLYANAALQASLLATQTVLGSLKDHGSLQEVSKLLAGFKQRQDAVKKPEWDAREALYATKSEGAQK
ncbi:isocitrate lyase/PEP mutase family protein [Roseovarius sp. SK2]|uniref:isocitrate lyase/PEP mutase family protein n=1 Tax=Roseovarius TaxID=74030 RepID=UPI00237B3A9E|nr:MULTISPECIES: isocitrate lyase/PEP mutase family protein [unclassified Roseovarius]MDD9725705.1 isocitrate lyase/PEP mutase family protein [Roseovarius sp. SK2]